MPPTPGSRLEKACAMVVEDGDLVGGRPVIRGTRVPVHDVAASLAAGISVARIQSAYGLTQDQVELAGAYAAAFPAPADLDQAAPPPAGASRSASRFVPHGTKAAQPA